MNNQRKAALGRRDVLLTLGGVTLAAAAGSLTGEAHALPANYQDRRKARYQADSPEVQEFYRVNRYPAK
jgi:hypothetical protein